MCIDTQTPMQKLGLRKTAGGGGEEGRRFKVKEEDKSVLRDCLLP